MTSILQRDFKDSTHQPTVEDKDDGARLVKSRGLAFVPCATAEIALDQGLQAPTTKVISRVSAGLSLQDRSFDPALDWMQSSFIAQADGAYTEHISTRQEPQRVEFATGSYWGNTILTDLGSGFPCHFLPNIGTSADRKEERVEWNVGAEAIAAVGGEGLHAGAGAEDSLYIVGAGAGPLPARQTTIVWPVVVSDEDGSLHIPVHGAGTGRTVLSLPSQPSGAVATALGMSGPPG